MRKKLLWVGDAGCPSGFAKATHEILDVLLEDYDVTVLGINYRGDPPRADDSYMKYYQGGRWPYPLYAAATEGDAIGYGRLIWMCDLVKPDVIVFQNDGWNIPPYIRLLRARKANGEYYFPDYASIPIVAVVAVDGENFRGEWLDGVSLAIFWTQFGLTEARKGGYAGQAEVIPLGVDRQIYRPMNSDEARKSLPVEMQQAFIVGNVNRNQSRKRWDLTLRYFAAWVERYKIMDACLYLHTAPTGDDGPDVKQLARYYGINDRVAFAEPKTFYGLTEQGMARTYNCFDVLVSTSQGEGFGLTALEAMACGVPCILPDNAAFGEWAKRGAWLVPCQTVTLNPGSNVIGSVPDETKFTQALQRLYVDPKGRAQNAEAALECAAQPQFAWREIGRRYAEALQMVFVAPGVQADALDVARFVPGVSSPVSASVEGRRTRLDAPQDGLGPAGAGV